VIAYKDSGHTFTEVEGSGLPYEVFGVTARSYYEWKKQLEKTGGFVYNYRKEHKGKISPEQLQDLPAKHPDWYLREFTDALGVCYQAVQKKFVKLRPYT
jgi:transposase